MPAVDAYLFNKKGEKKILRVILDEDDAILTCIKKAMKENNVGDCKVENAEGYVKEATVNYMEGSTYKSKVFKDTKVFMASGHFKLNFDELFGVLHLSLGDKRPVSTTFVKGTAKQGLEIRLSYVYLPTS